MANATSFVLRGTLPSEMWDGLPYTHFMVDGNPWRVAGACSGKMLLIYLMIATVYRMFVCKSKGWWKLALLALPLSVLFNALRCFVVMKFSYDHASHDILGFLVYALVVVPCLFFPLDSGTEGKSK